MAAWSHSIEIDRPQQEVFAFATDPGRFPEWQDDVVSVEVLDGAEFRTTRRFGGVERALTQRITRNDPPHSWAIEGVEGPVRPLVTITVEPVDGTRSRLTLTLDFESRGAGLALLPLVKRQARAGAQESYRKLKRLLEGAPEAS